MSRSYSTREVYSIEVIKDNSALLVGLGDGAVSWDLIKI